jgi:hypothetical protein
MKRIPLTGGLSALVDDADYAALAKYRWCAMRSGRNCYAMRHRSGRGVYMHRQVMGLLVGWEVDHINHNGLDNRRRNLRLCTRRENAHNRLGCRNGSSRYKGVSLYKPTGKWRAKISSDGKSFYIGSFASQARAAKAYDDKAKELFGEFAHLNFPHRLRRRNIYRRLMATGGRMFSLVFIKRSDGGERMITARVGARVGQKKKGLRYCPRDKRLIVVFDMEMLWYRSVPIDGIEAVVIEGRSYRVD